MSESTTTAEAPPGASARAGGTGLLPALRGGLVFLGPTLVLLGVWIVYPTIRTIIRSFYDRDGDEFIGLDNYETLFSDDTLVTAIKNNLLWLLIVPGVRHGDRARVRRAPRADPLLGRLQGRRLHAHGDLAVRRGGHLAADVREGPLPGNGQRRDRGREGRRFSLGCSRRASPRRTPPGALGRRARARETAAARDVAQLGLTGIRTSDVPSDAVQAVVPEPLAGGITGVVWRDFKPGGGEPGEVEAEEVGLPGITVELRDESGRTLFETTTETNGTFAFDDVQAGTYRAAIGADTFSEPYAGVSWLGPSLITPAIMMAYVWVWAGFSMVVIAAGLAAIPRDLLEAARTDGATEWQVFRRVTIPLLAPVLTVVFVTMLIYVLKVFDIVISVAPGSVQDDANVIALAMWRTSFGGVNDLGLGSAIAVFLFLLVIPILVLNIRRFRREA